MIKNIIAFSFALIPVWTFATAPYEDEIRSITVKYVNGGEASINCKNLECDVVFLLKGRRFTFTPNDLKGFPFPKAPVLFGNSVPDGFFSFEIQHYCKESNFPVSQEPAAGLCIGVYGVENGKIVNSSRFFRNGGREIPLVNQ